MVALDLEVFVGCSPVSLPVILTRETCSLLLGGMFHIPDPPRFDTPRFRLFKNPFQFSPDTVLDDLQECDYLGYSESFGNFSETVIGVDQHSDPTTGYPLFSFQVSLLATEPQSVWGIYLYSMHLALLLGGCTFNRPYLLSPGQILPVYFKATIQV